MGVDIWTYVEVERYGRWQPVYALDDWYEGRCYQLFGMLAGVRGGEALWEPRGVPEDATAHVRDQWGEGNGVHSASWLTLKELLSVDWGEAGGPRWQDYLGELVKLQAPAVRVVFWFDS